MFEFLHVLEGFGNKIAFKSLDGINSKEISYLEYLKDIGCCAYSMEQQLGKLKGRRVGVFCESNYEYTVVLAALMFSRAVVVPINILETASNIKYMIEDSDIDVLILEKELEGKIQKDIVIDKHFKSDFIDKKEKELLLRDFSDEEADNPLLIIYTSGTTGLAKGVVLSVSNIFGRQKVVINSDFIGGSLALSEMKAYVNFPFYHVAGISAWTGGCESGCTLYLSHNIKNILTDLETENIDIGVVTPAVLKLWEKAIKRGRLERLGGVKLIASAGAKIDSELIKIFLNHGILFGQFYGMTEAGGNVTCNFNVTNHFDSVGKPVDGVELFIEDGEICIKGWGIMSGYYKKQEDTQACLKNGILYSGDLGYIDEDGYVYITGRKKNLIILSSGENVSPEELEKMIYSSNLVNECQVYEDNDRIVAGVFAEEDKQQEIRQYIADLNKTLPIYKRIYRIDFQTGEFEKTASGKIKR